MIIKIDNCQLEIDKNRGVVYVHSPKGMTLVRVCKIPLSAFGNNTICNEPFVDVVYDRELAKSDGTYNSEKVKR